MLAGEESDFRIKVTDGNYQLKLLGHWTETMYTTPRLKLEFSIVDLGEFHGETVSRYYNVERLIGKAGKKGRFKAKQTGDFLIEYFNLFPHRKIKRRDRIPMEDMYNEIIIGKVRTVKKNNQQKRLPEQLQYSVIEELLRIGR
jgi:hypothetical protein